MPSKDDVVERGADPITTKELRERAEEEFGMRKARRGRPPTGLKRLGLAEKVSKKEWVEAGRLGEALRSRS